MDRTPDLDVADALEPLGGLWPPPRPSRLRRFLAALTRLAARLRGRTGARRGTAALACPERARAQTPRPMPPLREAMP